MRLSQQKSLLFKSSLSPKKTLKQPKQLITKLNTDIETVQNSIRHYNEMEKKSANWKQQMNFAVYNCQLKALSQPKLQNILLESNFANNFAIFAKQINQSALKNSTIKLKNTKTNNFMMNSSGLGFRKTMSMKVDGSYNNNRKINDQNQINKSQKSIGINASQAPGYFVEDNPELSFYQARPQFHSFREEINQPVTNKKIQQKKSTNDKLYHKGKLSQISQMSKNLEKCPSKNMHSDSTIFDENAIKDNQTLIGDESKSIMMQTSTKLFSQEFENSKNKSLHHNNFSKELGLIPISQEKMITLSSQRKGKSIREQIQQKAMRLEKQWELTECYRQKFNIIPSTTKEQSRISRTSQKKLKPSVNKLANIIQKVQERRPSTSMAYQRTQNSRQTTLNEDIIKQRSKTIALPEPNNESINFNISIFGM